MARTKTSTPTHEEFVFRVSAPSADYSYRIQHDRRQKDDEPFEQREAIQFTTECIWPGRFKGRSGKATIYPEPALAEPQGLPPDDPLRRSIGFIKVTKMEFQTVIWLPPQDGWRLGEAIASGLISSMLTNGLPEPRGMNRVISVSFHGSEFDPVEYVG